jgi:capsule polysaccharide export protein KpsE/RkpR
MEANNNMSESWWNMLGVLYRWRRFIVIVTGGMAVLSVIISLMLPLWYKASSRLLMPESSGGGLASALLGDLGSAAKSLLGGSGGDYVRFMAILDSRAVKVSVIEEFDLIAVYDVAGKPAPLEAAIEALEDNVEFVVDDEYDFMSIEVYDRDPVRAAAMSNFYLAQLDSINNRLNRQTAGNFRAYVEQRYERAAQERQALLDSLQHFQERYGVFNLEAQTEAFFTQVAEVRANAVQVELQYEALRRQFGEDNQQVQQLASLVDAADALYRDMLQGREAVLPVDLDVAPAMVRAYADIAMERLIQETILEMVAPILEQARFEEERQQQALQIVDEAVPPHRKAKPKRAIVVIAATLSAFILAVIYALLTDWWRRRHAVFTERLRTAAANRGHDR